MLTIPPMRMTWKSRAQVQQQQRRRHVKGAKSQTMYTYNAAATFTGKPVLQLSASRLTGLPCGDGQTYPLGQPADLPVQCNRQCLLDAYQIEACPSCSQQLITSSPNGTQQLLVNLHNEGGLQENLDILPLLKEEQYLKAYPEEIKARAFLEFCREGDVNAIIGMLKDEQEESDDDDDDAGAGSSHTIAMSSILRYQDPIGEMQSGLHAAVQAGSREVAWLLLLVASDLDFKEFPVQVFQEAETVGIMRAERISEADIRTLRDSEGRSAEDLAREMGGFWAADGWIGSGRLTV